MSQKIVPFLTFNGNTKEIMDFYADVFPDSKIVKILPYGEMASNEDEKDYIFHGEMEIMGMTFQFMDMVPSMEQAPTINWASSLYVELDDETQFDQVFQKLSNGGVIGMGPEPAGDMKMASSITDKYGVTWNPFYK